jgi:fatty acid-binding protein DegV
MIVRAAVRLAEQDIEVEEAIRRVRGTIDRIYVVYYVEEINALLQNSILSSSHTILGSMLEVKPFLSMDDGEFKPIEKVRTRIQAIDRLVEFVVEFTEIEDVVILQNKSYISDQTRMLQDRLAIEFPGRHFPYTLYGPSLTALIGTEVTGITLLESETEYVSDGF